MDAYAVEERDDYVVVGGQANRELKIASSSHTFQLLADGLYSDKVMACVREIICNAYDAHIEAGVDKPIEITLTKTELTIRDFGRGIPDDKIVDNYGTYCFSTKADDDRQIGGLGLGSKAPFAYAEQFTVTSCHNGVKSIYVMHIGDETSDGLPAIKPILSVPTDETGLAVTVMLKSDSDCGEFHAKILQVVKRGGMFATLNGEPIARPCYDAIKREGVGLVSDGLIGIYHGARNYVLFGNILYPLEDKPEYYNALSELYVPGGYRLIFNLEPDEVAVRPFVPSREALSYTKSLLTALTAKIKHASKEFELHEQVALKKAIAEKIEAVKPARHELIKVLEHHPYEQQDIIAGAKAIAEEKMRAKVFFGEHKYVQQGAGGKLMVQALRNRYHMDARWKWSGWSTTSAYINDDRDHYLLRRVLRAIRGLETANTKVYARVERDKKLVEIGKWRSFGSNSYHHPHFKLVIGPNYPAITTVKSCGFYVVARKMTEEQFQELEARAEALGLEVQRIIPEKRERKPKEVKPAPPVPKYRALRLDATARSSRVELKFGILPEPTIEKPDAFLPLKRVYSQAFDSTKHAVALRGYGNEEVHTAFVLLRQLYPNAVIATTAAEVKALVAAGVPRLDRLLVQRLQSVLTNATQDEAVVIASSIRSAEGGYDRQKRVIEAALNHSVERLFYVLQYDGKETPEMKASLKLIQTAPKLLKVLRNTLEISFDDDNEVFHPKEEYQKLLEGFVKTWGEKLQPIVYITKHLQFLDEEFHPHRADFWETPGAKHFLEFLEYKRSKQTINPSNTETTP